MRLLVVAGGTRRTASTRHRLWNYRPYLEADGVALEWIEYGGGRISNPIAAARTRVRFLAELARHAGAHEVVIVQKVLPPAAFLRRWRAHGARVVYDFDDALFAASPLGEPPGRARRRKARLDAALSAASVVLAGSPPLARYARTVADRVEVFYPSLAEERFRGFVPTRGAPDRIRVGWVGNDQSQIYLKSIESVLERAFARHPRARLVVCSSRPPRLPEALAARMDFVPWSEEAELRAAHSFDVAVSPLGTEEWSRARGGRVSVLLSMAAGTPVLASPGGGLEELTEGSGGVLFADDAGTWARHLDALLSSAVLRRKVGEAARRVIDARVWARVQYPRWRAAVFGEDAG